MGSRAERRELRNEMRASSSGLLICVPLKCSHKINIGPVGVHVVQLRFPLPSQMCLILIVQSSDSPARGFPGEKFGREPAHRWPMEYPLSLTSSNILDGTPCCIFLASRCHFRNTILSLLVVFPTHSLLPYPQRGLGIPIPFHYPLW